MLVSSMSSFEKFRVSLLLSERILREMSFFMNCLICFVIEVSVKMKSIIVVDVRETTEEDVVLYELFDLFCC